MIHIDFSDDRYPEAKGLSDLPLESMEDLEAAFETTLRAIRAAIKQKRNERLS